MAGIKRERQLARERYLRQQARRQVKDAKRRRLQQAIAAVLTVVVVLIGAIVIANKVDGKDGVNTAITQGETPAATPTDTTPEPTPADTPAATPTAAVTDAAGNVACTFTKSGDATKDVGVPAADGKPAPYVATLASNRGELQFTADTAKAPCTTRSFAFLAGKKYFDGTDCHRLTTAGLYVLQCGDPSASGSGGPGYGFGIENAPADGVYPAGTIAMARSSDPASNGSQFFLVYKESQLPTDGGGYSIFGTMTKGMDVLAKVAAAGAEGTTGDGAPKRTVRLTSVTTSGS